MADSFYVAVLLIALIAALGAFSLSVRASAAHRRRRKYFSFAVRFGVNYSPIDRLGLIDHSFDLFNQADGARVQNVVWGTWQGVPVRAGELRFAPSLHARQDGARGKALAYSFAFTEIPAWVPHISIRATSSASIAEALGLERIRLESDAFNRAFEITCQDREFVYSFLDPRMMEWFLEMRTHIRGAEARGPRLLVHGDQRAPDQLVPLLGAARGFHERVPRVVLLRYAIGAPVNRV